MSVANTALKVADLDFISIRNNLKNYLKGQSEFTDYDFEGSGMAVLLDVLAYNTYYNGFYLNMVANESFLDTAQIRQNILSHAKAINYIPTSRRGSQAVVNITINPTENPSANVVTMDKYTRFLGADINGTNYPFVSLNSNTAVKVNGTFSFANVYLRQGEVVTQQFNVEANNQLMRFEIPSSNVDTSTIAVTVQESPNNTTTLEFFEYKDINEITGNTYAYFVEENDKLNYTVYFGDGYVGYKPKIGSVVIVTYLETLGALANNISKFTAIDLIGGQYRSGVATTTVTSSFGGIEKEPIDQIRLRAPYYYTTQNRMVTMNDYETLLLKDYNNIESVSIWGGEDNDPPTYGKVYISLKTKGYYALSNLEKETIKEQLINNRNVVTVTPEIIDPEYAYIQVRGRITFNPNLTTLSASDLLAKVKAAINSYSQKELNTFRSTFRKSKLSYYIDSSDPSITGSDVNIYLQRQIRPVANVSRTYEVTFNTPLRKGDYVNKLYTYPQVKVYDASNNLRDVFYEEVPESFTGVGTIEMISGGQNYERANVTITGDGTGAKVTAKVILGKINSITVTNPGINYTRATVNIVDDSGVGAGASAIARIQTEIGTLRSYYFKTNGEKVIVNSNAGNINYRTGKIVFTDFNPVTIIPNSSYESGVFTISVSPVDQVIPTVRNRILVIDENVKESIQVELFAES